MRGGGGSLYFFWLNVQNQRIIEFSPYVIDRNFDSGPGIGIWFLANKKSG